jgi:MFS family permease
MEWLEYAYAGLLKLGIPLACFDGSKEVPFGVCDDIGIYVLLPKLARLLNIPISGAVDLFFYGLIFSSFAVCLFGLHLLYRSVPCFFIALFNLSLVLYFLVRIGDVYTAYCAAILGLIPLSIYLLKEHPFSEYLYGYWVMVGAFAMGLHYIRAYSSLAAIGFIGSLILLHVGLSKKQKVAFIFMILLGATFVYAYFNGIDRQYNAYRIQTFGENDSEYKHPLWHTIYLGFGFLKYLNSDEIEFDDSFGPKHAQKIDATCQYATSKYEKILKYEVWHLITHKPFFVIATLFAKLGLLAFYLMLFANFGLLCFLFFPLSFRMYCAYFVGFSATMIFPIIALPTLSYSMGFICLASLFGIMHCNQAVMGLRYGRIAFSRAIR